MCVPLPIYDIITSIEQIMEMNIYDESFFAEVYELLIMETNSETCNRDKFIIRNTNTLSADRVTMHERHKRESISVTNSIITEFHLLETSNEYTSLIDRLNLSEMEIRQTREMKNLLESERTESIETRPIISLLTMAIYDIINAEQVLDCCDYRLQRNRIQAIKILLNVRNKLKTGMVYDHEDVKSDLLWKVELCNGWNL